jgi:hypothetical protein
MGTKTKRNRAMAEDHRQKIKVAALLNFVQEHALDDRTASPTRLDAAKFLLNKAIANPPTEVSGPNGGSIPVDAKVTFVGTASTPA